MYTQNTQQVLQTLTPTPMFSFAGFNPTKATPKLCSKRNYSFKPYVSPKHTAMYVLAYLAYGTGRFNATPVQVLAYNAQNRVVHPLHKYL